MQLSQFIPHSQKLEPMTEIALRFHIFACFAMMGVIWLVQLVQYPMFAYLAQERFAHAHAMHSQNITFIVFPLMGLELLTALYLVFAIAPPGGSIGMVLNLVSVLALWKITALVFVPLHNRLAVGGYDIGVIERLVRLNWWRTAIWSARTMVWLAWWLSVR